MARQAEHAIDPGAPIWIPVVLGLLTFGFTALGMRPLALAQSDAPQTWSLSWTRLPGAEACITAPQLARRVERRLQSVAFVSAAAAERTIEGQVAPSEGGWGVSLRALDAQGETIGVRELDIDEPDCARIESSLVLVIALMIDPDAASTSEPRGPRRTRAPPPIREKIVFRAEPWRFGAAAEAVGALGQTPRVAAGVRVSGWVTPPAAFPLELALQALYPQSQQVDQAPERQLRWLRASVGLAGCPPLGTTGSLAWQVCGEARLGYLRVDPSGFDVQETENELLPEAVFRLRSRLSVDAPFALQVGMALVVPVLRPRVVYSLSPAVTSSATTAEHITFEAWPIAVTLTVGLATDG